MLKINKYKVMRELVINVGTLVSIASLYVAYLLGAENWELAVLILLGCILANNLLMRGWLWLIRY